MKRFFHSDLEELRSVLALMGDKACEVITVSVEALLELDPEKADNAIQADDEIDKLEVRIDQEAIRYIALRAPAATDLRTLTVAMKTCHDLERVGDEATKIAKRAKKMVIGRAPDNFLEIGRTCELAVNLLRDAMKAFIAEDLDRARLIPPRDKEIDRLNENNYMALTDVLKKDPELVHPAVELMFVSKSLERVGDHAVNIAEEVIYMLSGEDVRHTGLRKQAVNE